MFEISYLLSITEPCQYISGMVFSILNTMLLGELQSLCPLAGTGEHHQAVQKSIEPDLSLSPLLETLFCDDTWF